MSGKTTEEGFKIYDDEELRIDPNAGNTDDCPFDCDCMHTSICVITMSRSANSPRLFLNMHHAIHVLQLYLVT